MDPGTLIGVVVAFAAIFVSMIMEGGNPASIILPPAMLLVFGGTFGVSLACGTLPDAIASLKAVKDALLSKKHSSEESVTVLVEFAEVARREGLLALESRVASLEDPFLQKGVQMAVDGTDPDELREILEAEIATKKANDKVAAKFFADMGGFAPTLGIIGTVLGLIHVLENLSEPDKLGHLIAGAFVATLWGVLTANVMWLPFGKKLQRVSDIEAHHMELVVEGILSIQAGANPRLLEQKLLSLLPPKERAAVSEQRAA